MQLKLYPECQTQSCFSSCDLFPKLNFTIDANKRKIWLSFFSKACFKLKGVQGHNISSTENSKLNEQFCALGAFFPNTHQLSVAMEVKVHFTQSQPVLKTSTKTCPKILNVLHFSNIHLWSHFRNAKSTRNCVRNILKRITCVMVRQRKQPLRSLPTTIFLHLHFFVF